MADKEVEHAAQIKAAKDDGREEEAESVEAREKRSQEIEELKKEIRERKAPEIETVKKAVANVWITEMRFARRSDVRLVLIHAVICWLTSSTLQGLRQARQVFLKAKKSPNLTWQVVEASGELPCSAFSSRRAETLPSQRQWRCTGIASRRSRRTCSSSA